MMGFWDAVTSAGPYSKNLHLTSDNYHTNTSSLRPDALPDAQPTADNTSNNGHAKFRV